jgi:hypothetical protein
MTRRFSLAMAVGAALVLGLASAEDAQAWFGGRGGGSNGSNGSGGGWFSGGSNGSNGSHGGLFRGFFGRRSNGSCGSSGGYYQHNGCCDNCGCGCGEATGVDAGEDAVTPPEAPKDPGQATPQAPAGGREAAVEPTAANKSERVVMRSTAPVRRPLLFGR